MTLDPSVSGETLSPILHHFALAARDRVIGTLVCGGALVSSMALFFSALASLFFLCLGTSMAMLGVWALAERHVHQALKGRSQFAKAVRVCAAFVGSAAGVGVAFSVTGAFLGQWIS
jgi:hypothetical protein